MTMVDNGVETASDSLGDFIEETPVTVTFREFFDGLNNYTFVMAPYNEYIFTGYGTDDDGELVANLQHSRYMEKDTVDNVSLDNECEWTVVKNDDGTIKQADRTLRHALRHMESNREAARAAGVRVGELEKSFSEAVSDFKILNDHLSEYAKEVDFCGDYERRLWTWNETFAAMKLHGRVRNYQVPVMIPALSRYELNVYPVEARSPEEALETVRGWSTAQLLRVMLDRGYDLATLEITDYGTPSM